MEIISGLKGLKIRIMATLLFTCGLSSRVSYSGSDFTVGFCKALGALKGILLFSPRM